MTLILLLIIAVIVLFGITDVRRQIISKPIFGFFKKVLPPLSQTEREAMEAGTVWWDGELFSGKPDWQQLHNMPQGQLSDAEKAFIDNQVDTLLRMLDDHATVENKDLAPEVWDYLKKERFFSMIIPKSYGGLEFSALGASTIVARIASRSLTAAITVMVPNSLGPGELLSHYGTEEQKQRWLPGLADGTEVPCFALTGPEAGSDAGAIPDSGVVCMGEYEGEQVLGLRLNWEKRYITLAPVATVLGLAFKMRDPDGLLGDKKEIGITCALIPASHPGVELGNRHNPLNMSFMNGTTRGKDVFIPLDWIIGGQDYAGRGWRMLVECLSAGRGISLPALATSAGHVATRTTSAYCGVRQQFGVNIGQFEGVQEALARITANTYLLEAARKFTVGAIDMKQKPSVVTAIAKYHMTEIGRQIINDAMDIHGGKGIQLGPKNYLGNQYMAQPVSITVEGANILTRNLMIFGQGATRCHPYVLSEMEAVAMEDSDKALKVFDGLLFSHMLYGARNAGVSLLSALTGSRIQSTPVAGETGRHYRNLSRLSANLALMSDLAMATLGGSLKQKEMISARLGDVLSQLYLASAVLRHFEAEGRQQGDLPLVHYSVEKCCYEAANALEEVIRNFPSRPMAWLAKLLIFPVGNHFCMPKDALAQAVCQTVAKPNVVRERITHLCALPEGHEDGISEVESAFVALSEMQPVIALIKKAMKKGKLPKQAITPELIDLAADEDVISSAQAEQLQRAWKLRLTAIHVDEFASL
ncbi:acyl-CoA dehydrogenase [Ferrimonas aestuarii]|uniref:Acyl-coenzyme A dehydrogenase n=1 Tax=Ferrimonas aestuarii TaxID=2569539 RepID=A0A4U1BL30_9GAMM|nr:acyl-CoA dehydrogenase [Ferrimonas aestuarii]TKB51982.1 acyl-CoA dehydrogenase [Ferrimonas aestuarii]